MKEYTWDELKSLESGTILDDGFIDGVRYLIMRAPGSLTAYLGIPSDHPLSGFDYDDVPIDCHGGLTFAHAGDGEMRPAGYYWYGWDYAHLGDCSFYRDEIEGHKWMPDEVLQNIKYSIYSLKQLMNIAEKGG